MLKNATDFNQTTLTVLQCSHSNRGTWFFALDMAKEKINRTDKIMAAKKNKKSIIVTFSSHTDNRYFPLHFVCDEEIDSLCYVTHKKPHYNKTLYLCVQAGAEQLQLVISVGKSKLC